MTETQPLGPANWLSLGENCLPDNILERNGLKMFSTPFSHGRSNIDYAIQLHSEGYSSLLRPEFLYRDSVYGQAVVRNSLYRNDAIFDASVASGFEFTHHDVIASQKQIASYDRKVARLKAISAAGEPLCFLYHHRMNRHTNLEALFGKVGHFQQVFRGDRRKPVVAVMRSVISATERKVEVIRRSDTVFDLVFTVRSNWAGSDNEVFWAKVDDDLIVDALSQVIEATG